MQVSQSRILEGISFEDYLKIPAFSFSGLRGGAPETPTPAMQLGTRVDNYRFEPHKYDGVDYARVKACAQVLNNVLGKARPRVQVSVIANLVHNGKYLPVKGRIDMLLPNLVADLKISKMDLVASVNHFRYDWQVSGYSKMSGCSRAMIISINPLTFKPSLMNIPIVTDWWEHQILTHGKAL